MNIWLVVFAAIGLFVLVVVGSAAIACRYIFQGKYEKALKYLNLLPKDQSNLIRPVDIAYLEILAGTYDSAEVNIQEDMKRGTYPLHHTLLILLYASKGDWQSAEKAYEAANAAMQVAGSEEVGSEDVQELRSLRSAISSQNQEQIAAAPVFVALKEQLTVTAKRFYWMLIVFGVIAVILIPLTYVIE